jgi:hypothetical protein
MDTPLSKLADLDLLARDINARMAKVHGYEDRAKDHRLSLALRLAEAKHTCIDHRINFPTWCQSNLNYSYSTIRPLLRIGLAPNPEKELRRYRGMQAANAERYRLRSAPAQLVEKIKRAAKTAPSANEIERVLRVAGPRQKAKVINNVIDELDLAIVTKDQVGFKIKSLESLRAGFVNLTPEDRITFVQWAADRVGLDVINPLQYGERDLGT